MEASTPYPKITNHMKEVLTNLRYYIREKDQPVEAVHLDPIPLVGTVKLHGTHADILIYLDDTIVLQSRNNVKLSELADNHGFAKAMSKKRSALCQLRNRYVTRWKKLNPSLELDAEAAITIAGEWIGENIQEGVALSQLSKRFVVISVKIDGKWIADEQYADIHAEDEAIYNISRGGFYHATLLPDELTKTSGYLEKLAEGVAARCPFAETFGVIGLGEGIVWKLEPWTHNSDLWFKTKGGKFKPTFIPAPKKAVPSDDALAAKREAAERFGKAWCSEKRLEQGYDVLREKQLPQNMKGLGEFLKWVTNDVLVEENICIEEHSVDVKTLRATIVSIAKPWYFDRCH